MQISHPCKPNKIGEEPTQRSSIIYGHGVEAREEIEIGRNVICPAEKMAKVVR